MELMSYPHVYIASNFGMVIMKYDKGIVKKNSLRFNWTCTNVRTTYVIPSSTSSTSNQFFCSMLDAHTLHMDICKFQTFFKHMSLHTFFSNANGLCPWSLY